jgi:hypothetical protein
MGFDVVHVTSEMPSYMERQKSVGDKSLTFILF